MLSTFSFLDLMWSMIVFFAWVVWIIILITVFVDIFRRHDIHGGKKVIWILFCIILPFIGVFSYIVVYSHSMAERNAKESAHNQEQFDSYIKKVSGGGSAAEIAKAKELLDSGAITQAEFDQIKAKALAS